ncbi:phosphotransferase family protein [Pendulispora brunnea]|uniref:phosphotransferase family protein n=1 Tax=Pendulispora brunnea TaxID=2905690 RepID=UPI00374E1F0A
MQQVLHGEFHTGHLLVTPRGLRLHDFECACRGPVEWDIAGLENPASYGALDETLFARLRTMKHGMRRHGVGRNAGPVTYSERSPRLPPGRASPRSLAKIKEKMD